MADFKYILFPVDLSESSISAVPFVKHMAKTFGSTVTVFGILEIPPLAWGSLDGGGGLVYWTGDFKAQWAQSVQDFVDSKFANGGVSVSCKTETGSAAQCIVEFARRNHVDFIMIPTHGLGTFRRLLLGSTTAKVLHDSECPVGRQPTFLNKAFSITWFPRGSFAL